MPGGGRNKAWEGMERLSGKGHLRRDLLRWGRGWYEGQEEGGTTLLPSYPSETQPIAGLVPWPLVRTPST